MRYGMLDVDEETGNRFVDPPNDRPEIKRAVGR